MTLPAARDLFVKLPGAMHDQGSCIFDTMGETIVQFSPQEAGEPSHVRTIHFGQALTANWLKQCIVVHVHHTCQGTDDMHSISISTSASQAC